MALIYLDTNVYCRPFDNQKQLRIREETESFEEIIFLTEKGDFDLLSSDVLIFEVKNVFDLSKRSEIEVYLPLCRKHVEESEEIRWLALEIKNKCRTKARDAIHIASAILGGAKYFLTCDDGVIQRSRKECVGGISKEKGKELTVENPTNFVKSWKEAKR